MGKLETLDLSNASASDNEVNRWIVGGTLLAGTAGGLLSHVMGANELDGFLTGSLLASVVLNTFTNAEENIKE